MKNIRNLILHITLQFLSGFAIAFLASLLIYFKQKELLHLGVVLFLAFVIHYSINQLRKKVRIQQSLQSICMILILLISWLGPQFIDQIRPYTFYISGFGIAGIALVALATCLVGNEGIVKYPLRFGAFVLSFFVGYFLSWEILNYVIIAFSFLSVVLFLIQVNRAKRLVLIGTLMIVIVSYYLFSHPILYHDEQEDYEDKVVYAADTQFHKLVITQWHKDHWIFIDKLKNISSIDEYLFYEPMAHSVFKVGQNISDVLVIGGENGCLIREILKHDHVQEIEVINYDTLLRKIASEVQYITEMNQDSYYHEKVTIIYEDLIDFISKSSKQYDAVFVDLPDPRTIETNQFYTLEFYEMISRMLTENGVMITQAGSPYFASQAYFSIGKTIEKAGFNTLPIHNQILTIGEWGWFMCSQVVEHHEMKVKLVNGEIPDIYTKWFNKEAAKLVSAFGKSNIDTSKIGINTIENPLVYRYYLKGNWEMN